jgi:hypothetical protein
MALLRLMYKPLGIVMGLIAARVGRKVFHSIWARFDDSPPPNPESGEASTTKMIAARALEAGVMAGVAAGFDHAGARIYHHLIGIWPGKPAQDDDDDGDEARTTVTAESSHS